MACLPTHDVSMLRVFLLFCVTAPSMLCSTATFLFDQSQNRHSNLLTTTTRTCARNVCSNSDCCTSRAQLLSLLALLFGALGSEPNSNTSSASKISGHAVILWNKNTESLSAYLTSYNKKYFEIFGQNGMKCFKKETATYFRSFRRG